MKYIYVILLIILTSISVSAFEISPDTNVVIQNPTASEEFACNEFIRYIKEITGYELKISNKTDKNTNNIYIGSKAFKSVYPKFDFKKLKNDGIVIKSNNKILCLSGDGDRGNIYSVYTFLEEYCGVRYIMPDEDYIPKSAKLSFENIDYVYNPPFMFREVFGKANNTYATFSVKQKLNGIFPKIPDNMGGHIKIGKDTTDFVHTFRLYLNPEKYGKDHPEWFSLRDGKRVPTQGSQICLSNEDAKKEFEKNFFEYVEKYPCPIYSISQNDNQNYCECDKCKALYEKYGHIGAILTLINPIAKRLEKEYPGKYIETLAYHYTRGVPKNIKPYKNVLIQLCSAEVDFSKTFKAQNNKDFYKDLKDWAELSKNMYVWDYTLNYNNYIIINPNLHVQQENIQTMRDSNVVAVFSQGNHGNINGPMLNIKRHIVGKLLWNPDIDVEKEIKTYCDIYYGDASDYMREYIKLCENAVSRDEKTFLNWGMHNTSYLSVEDYVQGFELLINALNKVDKNSKYYNRVMCEYMCFETGLLGEKKSKSYEVKSKINLLYPKDKEFYETLLEFAKNNEMPYYNEVLRIDKSPYAIEDFKTTGEKPELCKNLKDDEWIDLPADKLEVVRFFNDSYAHLTDDPQASGGKSMWLNPEYNTWFVQKYLTYLYLLEKKKADVYLTYRVEPDNSNKKVMTFGIYNVGMKDKFFEFDIFANDTPDNKYKTVKAGEIDLYNSDNQSYLYFCGSGDKDSSKGLYVDRVFFVFKD